MLWMQMVLALQVRTSLEEEDFLSAFNNSAGKPFSRLTFVMAVAKALELKTLPTRDNPISLVLLALLASYVLLGICPLRKVSDLRPHGRVRAPRIIEAACGERETQPRRCPTAINERMGGGGGCSGRRWRPYLFWSIRPDLFG